mgnify:CR=1 FL=1
MKNDVTSTLFYYHFDLKATKNSKDNLNTG